MGVHYVFYCTVLPRCFSLLAVTPAPPPPPLLNPLTPSPSYYSHPHCPSHHLAPTFTAQYHHLTPSPLTPFTPSPLHSISPPHTLPSNTIHILTTPLIITTSPPSPQPSLPAVSTVRDNHSHHCPLLPQLQPRWALPQIVPACLRSSIENSVIAMLD